MFQRAGVGTVLVKRYLMIGVGIGGLFTNICLNFNKMKEMGHVLFELRLNLPKLRPNLLKFPPDLPKYRVKLPK